MDNGLKLFLILPVSMMIVIMAAGTVSALTSSIESSIVAGWVVGIPLILITRIYLKWFNRISVYNCYPYYKRMTTYPPQWVPTTHYMAGNRICI